MTLLSAVLPGLRELRAPFAAGALWLAIVVLIGYPSAGDLADLDAVTTLRELVAALPATAASAAALFGIYVLGMLTHGLASAVVDSVIVKRIQLRMEQSQRTGIAVLGATLRRPGQAATALVEATIRERLQNVSDMIASMVPRGMVMDEFELAALRLSKDAPEQFQEYDRSRAEGEFRTAIAPPVLVLGLVVAWMLTPVLGIALGAFAITASIGLAAQGFAHSHKADDLLATAIYFGYASTPILDNLVRSTESFSPNRPSADAQDFAWLCNFLSDRGLLLKYSDVISKARHPSRQSTGYLEEAVQFMKPSTRVQIAYLLKDSKNIPEGLEHHGKAVGS